MDPAKISPPAELEERLRFETLIADLSSKFINLPPGEVDSEIMDAERRLCEVLGLDISAIWQWSDEPPGFFALTHYYSVLEGPQPSKRLNVGDYPWFVQQMLAGHIVAISSLEEMPEEAAHDREICRQHGVKSNLCLPLSVGGKPVGILGLNTTQEERDWPDAVVKRLQLLAEILANALARKRADKALRESEERLSLAADSAEAGLWVLDCRTWIFWSTEKARVIFGYLPEEVLSFECFKSSVHPDDRTRVEEAVDRSLRLGEAVDIEYRIRLGDGRERWIASRGRPFFRANGEPERLMGVSMDITVRKKTEEQVRQLSLAVEQSPVSVVITDLQGKMIYVNRKFSEVSGYSFGECTGQNPRILKSREYAPSTYQELWKCITKGGTWRGEFHNRKKNGELYWEWAVISPLLDEAGEVTHFVGVKEDITERKEADEAFHASESRLAAGTDLAGLGYYEVDYGARTCFLDDRFREICGVPPEVQQGLEPVAFWLAHIHPDDHQRVSDERQALHEGTLHKTSTEYRYLHPIQGQRWIHHLARVTMRNLVGHTTRTFGVLRDITAGKQAEAEMQRLRLQLWHADRVAQTGAITASLAHELNQPLTGILSTAQAGLRFMANGNPAPGEIHGILINIVHDTKRAGAVINGLRAMLRRKETQREPITLADTIQETINLLHSEMIGRQVECRLHLESDFTVLADKPQIQQVLLNLVMNALEAMQDQPADQRRLELTLARTDTGEALVALRDSGPGIPEPQQQKLFEAFWTTKPQGLGIGLPISRSIIESHGGRLWFANNPDKGGTFYFALPLAVH